MSNAVFPTLPGLTFDVGKSPMFSTDIKTSVSGRELRRANWVYPIYQISLTFEFLRDDSVFNELKTLLGFYMQRQGSFDSFLFRDPDDSRISLQPLGTGDGVTTQFQLIRSFGGTTESVPNIASIDDGASMWAADPANAPMWAADPANAPMWADIVYTSTDYTINASGIITFNAAVPSGTVIVWSGSYYYRCRFADDQLDFNKFMQQLWTLKTCNLIGSLGARI